MLVLEEELPKIGTGVIGIPNETRAIKVSRNFYSTLMAAWENIYPDIRDLKGLMLGAIPNMPISATNPAMFFIYEDVYATYSNVNEKGYFQVSVRTPNQVYLVPIGPTDDPEANPIAAIVNGIVRAGATIFMRSDRISILNGGQATENRVAEIAGKEENRVAETTPLKVEPDYDETGYQFVFRQFPTGEWVKTDREGRRLALVEVVEASVNMPATFGLDKSENPEEEQAPIESDPEEEQAEEIAKGGLIDES